MSILKLKDSQGNWISVPTLKGDKGNGIQSAVLNNDYTLTLTFTDGTTYTTPSIRGEKGEQGEPATDMDIHICSLNEYDSETRIPTITSPDDKTFYLVPTEDGTSPDLFTEWVYVNNAWEMFGSASIDLSEYVKDTDYATLNQGGVVKVGGLGITITNGEIKIQPASSGQIKRGSGDTAPINASKEHEATFYGLAKASGDTTQSQSNNTVGQYTDEAKSAIQDMLDVPPTSELKEVNDSKADVIIESTSGDIISFNDGADDMPLKSLVVDINPVQDLNGYDSPWVGGGGKNLLDPTLMKDQVAWNVIPFYAPVGTVLTMSTNCEDSTTSTGLLTFFRQPNGTQGAGNNVKASHPVTQTIGDSGYIEIVQRNPSNTVSFADFQWQIEVGSTATDWTPYENICPISGHEAVNVYDDPLYGGNVEWNQRVNFSRIAKTSNGIRIDVESDGILSLSGVADTTYRTFYSEKHVIKGHKYLERFTTVSNPNNIRMRFNVFQGGMTLLNTYSYNKSLFGIAQKNDSIGMGVEGFVAGDVLDGVKIKVGLFDLTQMFGETVADYIYSLEAANEGAGVAWFDNLFPNDYYPYNIGEKTTVSAVNGKPYTYVNTPLGQTVYGGKLDVLSGELVIDRAMVDLGTLVWAYSGESLNHRFSAPMPSDYLIPSSASDRANVICSRYASNPSVVASTSALGISGFQGVETIFVRDLAYSDVNSFMSAVNGEQLVYRLATPITIQLTPNQINSLYGVNNIWADTGNTSVEYCADTEMYIEKVKPVINVDDVQINGQSIVRDGVANVPIATKFNDIGLIKVSNYQGLKFNNDGTLALDAPPPDYYIKAGTAGKALVVAINQHIATFYGLAKASGDTTQSQSSNAVGVYTEDAKSSIQNMLGITDKYSPKEWVAESETELVTNAHSVGDLFYIGETLYKVIADLNAGDAINVGVNVEEVDVNNILTDYATKEDVENNVSIVEKSASGAIASFVDGADDIPLKSLVVNIDPVQDLHGYDSPWVAGGGKNLLNIDREVGTPNPSTGSNTTSPRVLDVTKRYDGLRSDNYYYPSYATVSISGGIVTIINSVNNAYGCAFPFVVDGAENYTISAIATNALVTVGFYDAEWNYLSTTTAVDVLPTTITTPSNAKYATLVLRAPINETATYQNVQVEKGSTATDYAPYENLCPISGWTGMQLYQTGANVWDEEWEVGGIGSSTGNNEIANDRIRSTGFIDIKPSTAYYCSIPSSGAVFAFFYDADKTFISPRAGVSRSVFTTPSNARYMRFHTYNYGNTYNHDISINYPSTDHSYHPYTGRSITIQLGQTVYGGKLDVLSGVLTITYGFIDGEHTVQTDWVKYDAHNGFYLKSSVTGMSPNEWFSDERTKCNLFKKISSWSQGVGVRFGMSNNGNIFFNEVQTDYPSYEAWMEFIQSNNLQLTYPLATPITIQLTPHEVRSLLGQNNIFADTGDASIEYFSQIDEDLIDYIETSLKPYAKEEKLNDYVSDVQVNGTSIVNDGVANMPLMTAEGVIGVARTDQTFGTSIYNSRIMVSKATEAQIKNPDLSGGYYKPIVPYNQHISTFYGLAKAAGDTTQSQSNNAVGIYTDEAKTAIKQMLGIHDTIDSFVEEVTGTDVTITGQPSYRYNCGELYSLAVTPPSSGTIDFRFTSGSTPTVLTLPSTVKMPEWWVEVEANTIYEMCITDGIYCGVMTWAM